MALKNRTFHDLLHSLPQELYDKIYDDTFETRTTRKAVHVAESRQTPESLQVSANRKVVRVTRNYKPPILLQIDRDTRATFAKDYYSKAVFVFEEVAILDRFLASLQIKHVKDLKNLRSILCLDNRLAFLKIPAGIRKAVVTDRMLWYFSQDEIELSLKRDGLT